MRGPHTLLGLAALLRLTRGDTLPYNPARIFVAPNASFAYLLRHADSHQASLSVIDLSNTIEASDLDVSVISSTLPFLSAATARPYTPTLEANGDLAIVTGDCRKGAAGAEIWRFQPGSGTTPSDGTWTNYTAVKKSLGSDADEAGANYLAESVTFSSDASDSFEEIDIYLFGGMCPFSNATDSTWTTSATYSKLMLEVAPQESGDTVEDFDISLVTNTGPPIAQAGFSLTGLTATYSVDSAGTTTAESQDFILIGGNTGDAFINMSQLALFSLPGKAWTFVSVEQTSSSKRDLSLRRRTTEVTPRSGHTAVLSEDGSKIIVYGGWVGDVSSAADPQLAILELGSGYGGDGEWQWTIPDQSGSRYPSGLFGHGAALLPGNVMMITGGFEISSSSSSRRHRRDSATLSQKTYLYNITSKTWTDSYTSSSSTSQSPSKARSKQSQAIGLGVGLGLGAVLLLAVIAFYFWYTKRLKRSHKERQLLISPSVGSHDEHCDPSLFRGADGVGNEAGHNWPASGQMAGYPRAPEMQHTTGMFVNVPSPTRGLRRGFSGKSYQYHQAPRVDENGAVIGGNQIHTITESVDEDDEYRGGSRIHGADGLTDAESKLREVERVLNSADPLDPFKDPETDALGSQHFSPIMSSGTIRRTPTWLSRSSHGRVSPMPGQIDWMALNTADERSNRYDGRASPSKTDDRTSSTLSDFTLISMPSFKRTMSTNTSTVLAAAVAGRGTPSRPGSSDSQNDVPALSPVSANGRKSPFNFAASARPRSRGGPGMGDAESFMTARTTFAQLQDEGEALLGGRPPSDLADPYRRTLAVHPAAMPSASPTSPTYSSAPQPPMTARRRQGWVGSIRRALNVVAGERSFSLNGGRQDGTDVNTAASSPTKDGRARGPDGYSPRRTVSDGSALLRSKRGAKDWDGFHDVLDYYGASDAAGDGTARGASRAGGRDDDWGEPRTSVDARQAEEDWDVEGAVTTRDVQFLFTVPKSRLRVVNDDMDRASLRSVSDSGALSRAGSLRAGLRREESLKALRVRSEGDRDMLPSTAEEDRQPDQEKEKGG